jgi:hypothetical protein
MIQRRFENALVGFHIESVATGLGGNVIGHDSTCGVCRGGQVAEFLTIVLG